MDLFYDEDVEYARRLEEAGVDTTLEIAACAPHGFDMLVPSAAVAQPFTTSALDFVASALQTTENAE